MFPLSHTESLSYFEQFVWDLERRGVSDIDIPVLILGIQSPQHQIVHKKKEAEAQGRLIYNHISIPSPLISINFTC